MDFKAFLDKATTARNSTEERPSPYLTREPRGAPNAPAAAEPVMDEAQQPTPEGVSRAQQLRNYAGEVMQRASNPGQLVRDAVSIQGELVDMSDDSRSGMLRRGNQLPYLAAQAGRVPGVMTSAAMVGTLGAYDDMINAPRAAINAARSDEAIDVGEEYERLNAEFDRYYSGIPIRDKLIGGALGGIMGLPGLFASALEGSRRLTNTGTGFLGGVNRLLKNMGIGGAEAAAFSFMEGERSTNMVLLDGALGAGLAGGGQIVMGEALPAAFKGLTKGRQETVLHGIVDMGTRDGESGLSFLDFQRMAESADKIESPFELSLNAYPQARYLERVAGLMARTSFPRHAPGMTGGTQAQSDMFDDAFREAKRYRDSLPDRHRGELEEYFAPSSTEAQRRSSLDNALMQPRAEYERLFGAGTPDAPGPGATMLDGGTVQNDFIKGVAASPQLGGNLNLLTPMHKKFMRQAQHMMREDTQDPIARTIHMRPTNTYEIGEPLGPVALRKILDARKAVAAQMKVGTSYEGTTIDKETARAAGDVVRSLDDMLDQATKGQYGKNKDQFAAVMATQDAYDVGRQLAANPTRSHPVTGQSWDAYLSDTNNPLRDREAVRQGFSEAMYDNMQAASAIDVAGKLIGNPLDPRARRELGRSVFETVTGKDPDEFYALVDGQTQRADGMELVISAFEAKQARPDAQLAVVRDGDRYIITDPFVGQNENSLSSIAIRSALGRALSQPGEGSAMNTLQLLRQPNSQGTKDVLNKYVEGGSMMDTIEGQGARGSPGYKEVFDDYTRIDEGERQDMMDRTTERYQRNKQSIMDFLNGGDGP